MNERGRTRTEHDQDGILIGLQKGILKQRSFNKVHEPHQGPRENPSKFFKRIYENYRQYTEVRPEDTANFKLAEETFVIRCAPDFQRKLQKLEGIYGTPMSQLVEVALKVLNSWNQARDWKEQRRMKQQASLLAAAGSGGPDTK